MEVVEEDTRGATVLSQDIHLAAGAVRRSTLTSSRSEVWSLRERRQWKCSSACKSHFNVGGLFSSKPPEVSAV